MRNPRAEREPYIKCGAALAVGALDPGYLQRRWAPYVRAHEPGQVQLPLGLIRSRGLKLRRTPQPRATNLMRKARGRHRVGSLAARSPDGDVFTDPTVEPLDHALDPFRRGVGGGRARRLGRLRPLGCDRAGVPQGGHLLFEAAQALARLDQFVGDRERRHHGEPHVADFAELRPQLADAPVEVAGEPDQMILLAVLAGHAVLPSVDGDAHMSHDALPGG